MGVRQPMGSHDPQRGAGNWHSGWQEQADGPGAACNSDVTNNFPRVTRRSRQGPHWHWQACLYTNNKNYLSRSLRKSSSCSPHLIRFPEVRCHTHPTTGLHRAFRVHACPPLAIDTQTMRTVSSWSHGRIDAFKRRC